MVESSDFMPLGAVGEWSKDTATYHLARCVVDGKSLLKKSLLPQFLADERLRTCLRKEYDAGNLLQGKCPYVVECHQMIDTPEECSVLVDFVEGKTLDAFISEQPRYFMDASCLHAFMCQLVDAMSAIHHSQVVHLDIKPTNLMLSSVNNDLRIIDFGMSHLAAYPHTEGLTDGFAAPEQKNRGTVDCRTDIYAVGKILEYIETSLRKHADENYALPKLWAKVEEKCLRHEKEDRWQNAEEIQRYIQAEQLHGADGWGKQLRQRWLQAAALVLLFVVIGAALLFEHGLLGVATFHDEYGNRYQVKSQDSLTCILMGRDDTCTTANLYIEPTISHRGKRYSVVEIADEAFMCDKRLQTITLPHTLREIGSRAFRECKRLLVADLPDEVHTMGNMAFWGCEKLAEVRIPKSLDRIPSSCFSKTAIVKVEIPEGVYSIGYDAFGVCGKLRMVKLPQTLKTMERGVFWRCTSLRDIHIPAGVKNIGQFCLMECDSLRDVYNDAVVPQRVVRLFDKNARRRVILHVPQSSVGAYQEADGWSMARQVVAM